MVGNNYYIIDQHNRIYHYRFTAKVHQARGVRAFRIGKLSGDRRPTHCILWVATAMTFIAWLHIFFYIVMAAYLLKIRLKQLVKSMLVYPAIAIAGVCVYHALIKTQINRNDHLSSIAFPIVIVLLVTSLTFLFNRDMRTIMQNIRKKG